MTGCVQSREGYNLVGLIGLPTAPNRDVGGVNKGIARHGKDVQIPVKTNAKHYEVSFGAARMF
jgi:hypothetical protein